MSTLLQMRTLASTRLGQDLVAGDVPATNVFWLRADLNAWINEGLAQIWAELAEIECPTLLTETDATYPASTRRRSLQTLLGVTDDPLKVEEVRDVTSATTTDVGRIVNYLPHRNFQSFSQFQSSDLFRRYGYNRAWTWTGSAPMYLELFPVPTSAVTVRIRFVAAAPATLSADADTPSWLPTALHALPILYAVVQAKAKEESDSRTEWALYQEKLQRFRESAEERQQQDSRSVYVTDPSEYGGWLGNF